MLSYTPRKGRTMTTTAAQFADARRRNRAAKRALKEAKKTGDKESIAAAKQAKKEAWAAREAARKGHVKASGGYAGLAAQLADAMAGRDPAYEWTTVRADHPETKHRAAAGVAAGLATGSKFVGAAVAATSRTTGEGHASRERARAISRIEALKTAGWELVDETDYPARKGGYTEWTLRRHR